MTAPAPRPAPIINLDAVRSAIADAREVPTARQMSSPDPALPRSGEEAGERSPRNPQGWQPNRLGLPSRCPVKPLGVSGPRAWFLDPIGQVQCFDPPYGKGHLLGLFAGDANFLAWAWPRWGKGGAGIDGYAAEHAAASLIKACAALGPWNSAEKVRGRGCWMDRGGGLVMHTGTELLCGGKEQPPGESEGYVYPTRPELPTAWPVAVDERLNPAKLLRPVLDTWAWARPSIDPHLLLGWFGAAFLGGALAWRPMVYITGDKATGKSTLQGLIKGLFGDWMIQAVNTTPAGLYQHIGNDALAIAVDELEGSVDTRKGKGVLELARQSASGGLLLRGGDRHNPVEFRARSAFLFSSINTPPLEPQDYSRMALLRLHRLPPGAASPVMDFSDLGVLGRCILRRLLDEWQRFPETLAAFKGELARGGMDGRGQDQFGTLLACADLIEHQGWDEARLATPIDGDLVAWGDLLAPAKMAEFEDAAENWRLCLSHLLNVRVDAWRSGSRLAVGQVLTDLWNHKEEMNTGIARSMLAQAGLGLVSRGDGPRPWWLAIPNQNPLTRALFEGSKWAGDVGAGVWAGALRQSPRGTIHEVAKARINGDVAPATLISLKGLYGDGGIMSGGEG